MAVSQSISLTQGTPSVENNTTQVTFKWTSTQSGESYNDYTRTAYYYVSINGGVETKYSVSYTLPKASTKTIVSKTFTVKHKDDGSGSISIRTWMDTSISAGVVQKSQSLTLTTIPRASTFDNLACNTSYFNGTITYKYTPKSASFYNKMDVYIKTASDTYFGIKTIKLGAKAVSQQTATVTLSSSELSTIYGKLPTAVKGTLRFTLRTYSDSGYTTKVGNTVQKDIYLAIPTTIAPKLGTITLDPVNITTSDGVSRNLLVQGKNKIKVSISKCEPGSGSSIKSYTFAVLSGSTTIATTTTTSTSATFGPFSQTGALEFRVTVTDNRSRSTNNSGSEPTITCQEYDAPSFSSFVVYRCNSNGIADDNGTHIKYSLKIGFSNVDSTNNSTVKIYYKKSTDNSWIAAANALTNSTTKSAEAIIKNSSDTSIIFDANSTYLIYANINDNYGGSVNSSTITVFGASRVFNVRANGTGIAFGKMAETDNLLESKWPVKFDNSLTVGTSTQNSPPTGGITVHDIRNADITPDSFGDKNTNFYFDQIDSRWMGILHMKGWTGNYAAWELAGNAHNSSSDNTLKYRQGLGETWGDWQTVITNKNINNYVDQGTYLPLDGSKALTGKLTLDTNLYYASGNTAGIDCKNSDIININAMYFADASDSAGEAINFYRSDGYWSTLYAYDGILRFHPNRSTSSGLSGYKIYTSNNFRRGTCTLSTTDATITFSSALGGNPTVLLTPLTTSTGAIVGKVKSVSSTGFTAGMYTTNVDSAKFAYLAIYY